MKILITYSSKTGNTKKIADEIAKTCPQAEYRAIEQVDQFEYDLIFLGGWIDRGHLNHEVEQKMAQINNKNIAFFFTLGAYPTSKHAYDCITNIRTQLEATGNRIVNHYHCMGATSQAARDRMAKLPEGHPHYPDEARIKRWAFSEQHPNEEDYEAARCFVAGTLKALEHKE